MPQVEITVTGAPRFVGQHAVRAVRCDSAWKIGSDSHLMEAPGLEPDSARVVIEETTLWGRFSERRRWCRRDSSQRK